MTKDELRDAMAELKMKPEEMAEMIGISRRGLFYRLSGEFAIRPSEAKVVNMALASHRHVHARKTP
jgi:hypothetical protein